MALSTTSPDLVNAVATSAIREEVLRDPRYPVHRIADRLLPYLRVLVEQFQPEQVILFGSYAYGQPDVSSDVDLLVVMGLASTPVKERLKIREAWRPLHQRHGYLSLHLLLESPESHVYRLRHAAGFYDHINRDGVRLA
ncbi:MAG: nucleotidyltransferase domain-containing protein [Acidobacteriota bacterium]